MSATVTITLTRDQYEQAVTLLYEQGPQDIQVDNSYSVAIIPNCVLCSAKILDDGTYECVFQQAEVS